MLLRPEGRRHYAPRRIVPVLVAILVLIEGQMLDQRLAIDALSCLPGALDCFMRLAAGGVDDMERAPRHVGDHDGAIGGLAFDFGGTRIGMAFRPGDALCQEISLHAEYDITVLRMDQGHGAEMGAARER